MSYSIVNVHVEENYYEEVARFKNYDDADAKYDEWSEKLPHAWLEIVQTQTIKN